MFSARVLASALCLLAHTTHAQKFYTKVEKGGLPGHYNRFAEKVMPYGQCRLYINVTDPRLCEHLEKVPVALKVEVWDFKAKPYVEITKHLMAATVQREEPCAHDIKVYIAGDCVDGMF